MIAMCKGVPAIGPNMSRGPKRYLITTGINFRPMPSMGPIVSVVLYMVGKILSRKADYSTKLANATVNM